MDDLLSRISTVLERQDFRMCVPPESDDTDIVLEECRNTIESLRQQLAAAESNIDTLTKELEVQLYWGPRWEVANTERLAALAACEKKDTALQEVVGLISESSGVYGLHLNGDESPWEEVEVGGRFERLTTLPEALAIQPDASALKAHDDALIERCAVVCEQYDEHIEAKRDAKYQAEYAGRQAGAMRCAAAIRELKGKL